MRQRIRLGRWLKYKYTLFMRIKDSPASIATGAALGISFDVLPTFGLGVFFAFFLAALLKVNRVAAVIGAVVFKLAIPLFIYINYWTGRIFFTEKDTVFLSDISQSWLHLDWSQLGISFLIGSVINAVLIFFAAYFLTYWLVSWKRARSAKARNKRV